MLWWIWIIFGLALLFMELFVPSGFFIFFFGVGSLIIGLVLGIGFEFDPAYQWLACVAISLTLVLSSRRFLMGKWASPDSFSSNPEGREVVVTEAAKQGETGGCEFRGSHWSIRNNGSEVLNAGDKAVVERREGFTLLVRKI